MPKYWWNFYRSWREIKEILCGIAKETWETNRINNNMEQTRWWSKEFKNVNRINGEKTPYKLEQLETTMTRMNKERN